MLRHWRRTVCRSHVCSVVQSDKHDEMARCGEVAGSHAADDRLACLQGRRHRRGVGRHLFGHQAQLSGAFAHEQPGRFAAGNVALALAERAQGCRVVILLARDAHVDHGQACGAAPRFLDGASRIRCACPGGIGLIQPGDLPLAPLAHRRADGPGDRARARRRACVHAAPTHRRTDGHYHGNHHQHSCHDRIRPDDRCVFPRAQT